MTTKGERMASDDGNPNTETARPALGSARPREGTVPTISVLDAAMAQFANSRRVVKPITSVTDGTDSVIPTTVRTVGTGETTDQQHRTGAVTDKPLEPGGGNAGRPPEERVGQEHGEPFNQSECIRQALVSFSPKINREIFGLIPMVTLKYYIGSGEIDEDEFYPYVLQDSIYEDKDALADPETPLTAEKVTQLSNEARAACEEFGRVLTDHGRTIDITQDYSQEKIEELLGRPHKVSKNTDGKILINGIARDRSWIVVPFNRFVPPPSRPYERTTDLKLISSTESPDGIVTYSVTTLDDLKGKDPEFLTKAILNVFSKNILTQMAEHAYETVSLHEYTASDKLFGPDYIKELMQIADPEERKKQLRDIVTFMAYRRALIRSTNYLESAHMIDKMKVHLTEGDFPTNIDVAKHAVTCPGEAVTTRDRANEFLRIYHHIYDANSGTMASNSLGPITREALSDSRTYALRVDRFEEMHIEADFYTRFAEFVTQTAGTLNRETLLTMLKESMPQTYQKLTNFQKWINQKRQRQPRPIGFQTQVDAPDTEIDHFDNLIDKAAENNIYESEGNVMDIDRFLGRGIRLFINTRPKGSFPGIHNLGGQIVITDPQLAGILRLLVIKKMPSEAIKQIAISGDHFRRKQKVVVETVPALTRALADHYERQSHLLAAFKEETEISDDDLAAIAQDTSLPDESYHGSFGARLLAFLLQKKGIINDSNSASFQAFLKGEYPLRDQAVFDYLFDN